MRKRNLIIIAIAGAIGAIVLAAGASYYYYYYSNPASTETATSSDGLGEPYPKTSFYIWVNSLGSWNGSVYGSDFSPKIVEGSGSEFIEAACSSGGTYNATIQSGETGRELTLTAAWITLPANGEMTPEQWDKITSAPGLQRPIVLENETTTADYGEVTVSGVC